MSPDDCELAVAKLLEYGRWPDAIQFLAIYVNRVHLFPELVVRVLEHAVRGTGVETVNWGLLCLDVAELVKYLQRCGEIGEARLAKLEWYYLPLFREPGYSPSLLYKALAEDPEFFVGVLRLVYRSEAEEPGDHPREEQEAMARRAYDLLHGWRVPPGVREDGSVDPEKLHAWVSKARELVRSSGRSKIGDYHIGQILAHYPAGTDGAWPHEALRDLLEELASDEIDQGIRIGVINKRGTVTRSIGEGGAQERAIAQRYRSCSEAVRDRWPRVGRILASLATAYEAEARWEDIRDELHEDTWG